MEFAKGAYVIVTTRADGDQRPPEYDITRENIKPRYAPSLGEKGSIVGAPWTFVRQVHQNAIVCVDESEGPLETEADGIITRATNVGIGVLGADCSLVGLASPEGVVGVVHAGWKGLVGGVVEAGVDAMREQGARTVEAVIGPTIGWECYEFSPADLEPLVARFGSKLQRIRSDGTFALDLVAGVAAALKAAGVDAIIRAGGCTYCDNRFYSWRGRRDDERHALVVWREESS